MQVYFEEQILTDLTETLLLIGPEETNPIPLLSWSFSFFFAVFNKVRNLERNAWFMKMHSFKKTKKTTHCRRITLLNKCIFNYKNTQKDTFTPNTNQAALQVCELGSAGLYWNLPCLNGGTGSCEEAWGGIYKSPVHFFLKLCVPLQLEIQPDVDGFSLLF